MALRIGVNALYLIPGGVGGTEVYLRNLLGELTKSEDDFFIITNRETLDLAPTRANVRELRQRVPAVVRPARILWEQTAVPLLAARYRFDVLLNPGFTAPVICPCPRVTVFHDLQHRRHPEHFRWFDLPFWNLLLYASARRSSRLIAVSEATRHDLVRYYQRDAQVIPHGVEQPIFDIADHRVPENLLLCVSTLHPHKGIGDLLGAFAEFRATHPQFRLVLAGMRGFAADAIEERIQALGLTAAVELTGWITRERLYDLYRRAWAFVYPSHFEGFGMPVSEALAAGLPVTCSDIEPLRSLAGDGALLFTPGDQRSISEALGRIVDDEALRARLVAAGRRRAAGFTWPAAADATRRVLEEAALQPGGRR